MGEYLKKHRLLAGEGTVYLAISEAVCSWDECFRGKAVQSRILLLLRCDRG